MVLNVSFSNISVISWRSDILVEETVEPGVNHRPTANHWQILSDKLASSTLRHARYSKSQFKWWYVLIEQVVMNPTTIPSRRRLSMQNKEAWFYKLMVDKYMKLDRAPQMQQFFQTKQCLDYGNIIKWNITILFRHADNSRCVTNEIQK
jgi:hypothetical protein